MSELEGKYNIKAASLILGIQPGTLRAWERRYQMIAPIRNESGHRLYTEEHINKLKWLIKKVNQGFTISQAISLLENSQMPLISETIQLKPGNQLTSLSDELFDSLVHFDESRAMEIMNSLFSIFTLEKVMADVFRPILEKIREFRESEKIISAQEHFAASLIKTKIIIINHSVQRTQTCSKAVTIWSPGEGDDIDLLIFTYFLYRRGVEVIHLGPQITEEGISQVIKMIQPDYLFMSCLLEENLSAALTLISQLTLVHKELTFGLIGNAFNCMNETESEQFSSFIIGQTPNEWEKWLKERMRMI